MKLDGFAVQYLLSREFGDVADKGLSYKAAFDFPILYDVFGDMRGHVVLVPAHERPANDRDMTGTLCVCANGDSARSAREAGAAVLWVRGAVVFQHLYNRMQHMFVENERLDARLRALVDTYAGFQPLLDACTRAMGYSCVLIDDQYRTVCRSFAGAGEGAGAGESAGVGAGVGEDAGTGAGAGAPAAVAKAGAGEDALEPDSVDLFMAAREYRYMRASRNVFAVPNAGNLMMKNIFSKDQLVGSLLMEHAGDDLGARYVRFLLNYLGSFVEEAYGRIGSFGESSVGAGYVKAALQGIVAGDGAGYARLEAALAESGHAPGCEYVVLRVERSFTNEGAEERDYLARRLELAWPFGYCFTSGDELFMLVDASEGERGSRRDKGERADGKGFSKELPIVARDNLAKVGISRKFSEVRDFDAALVQARIALEHGGVKDPTGWCYRFGDYAFSWLASRAAGGIAPELVFHPAVTALLRYDEAHGTDLLHTLSVFMRCRYNATLAANELYVARSTLLHRLARIEELARVDFDNLADRTYLALSLAMLGR